MSRRDNKAGPSGLARRNSKLMDANAGRARKPSIRDLNGGVAGMAAQAAAANAGGPPGGNAGPRDGGAKALAAQFGNPNAGGGGGPPRGGGGGGGGGGQEPDPHSNVSTGFMSAMGLGGQVDDTRFKGSTSAIMSRDYRDKNYDFDVENN